MTDLSDLFIEDEASFDLELMGRKGDEVVPTGVVFQVRDLGNKDTQGELKRERNRSLGKRVRLKEDLPDEDLGAMMSVATTDPTDEMLAHCVTGWEWGEHTLKKYKLKFSYENVLALIKGEPWVRQQILMKALEVSGFTKA